MNEAFLLQSHLESAQYIPLVDEQTAGRLKEASEARRTLTSAAPADGFRSLDLLRSVSAQVVVIGHCFSLLLRTGAPIEGGVLTHVAWYALGIFSGHGFDAVAVFFVLSGLLVGAPLPGAVARRQFRFGDYVLRRLARMYAVLIPGLLFSALLVGGAFAWGHGQRVIDANIGWYAPDWPVATSMAATTGVCNALFLQTVFCPQFMNNSALWSLSNEMMYYLAFPALLLLFHPSTLPRRLASGGLFVLIVACWVYADHAEVERGQLFAVGFIAWLGGAYWTVLQNVFPRPLVARLCVAGLIVAVAVGLLTIDSRNLRVLSIAAITFAVLAFRDQIERGVRRIPALSASVRVASDYSYSLYVIHIPLLICALGFSEFLLAKVTRSATTFGLLLGVLAAINITAYLFHLAFERHYRTLYAVAKARLNPRVS